MWYRLIATHITNREPFHSRFHIELGKNKISDEQQFENKNKEKLHPPRNAKIWFKWPLKYETFPDKDVVASWNLELKICHNNFFKIPKFTRSCISIPLYVYCSLKTVSKIYNVMYSCLLLSCHLQRMKGFSKRTTFNCLENVWKVFLFGA